MKMILLFTWVVLFHNCSAQKPERLVSNADDNSLLWEISGKNLTKPSYLFGTFHLMCKEDISFSPNLLSALKTASEIYFEIDLDDPSSTLGALFFINMKNGKSLKDLYNAEQYERVTKFFKDSLKTSLTMVQKMKPNFIEALLYPKMLSCKTMTGIEQELVSLVKDSKKEIKGLETIAFQSSVFDSIPYEEQAASLLKTIDSIDLYKIYFDKMVKLYKEQRLSQIDSMFNNPEFGMDDKGMDVMLYQRNRNWVKELKMILDKKDLFIAVGAGHLPGKFGLINLLKKEGYTLRPILNK